MLAGSNIFRDSKFRPLTETREVTLGTSADPLTDWAAMQAKYQLNCYAAAKEGGGLKREELFTHRIALTWNKPKPNLPTDDKAKPLTEEEQKMEIVLKTHFEWKLDAAGQGRWWANGALSFRNGNVHVGRNLNDSDSRYLFHLRETNLSFATSTMVPLNNSPTHTRRWLLTICGRSENEEMKYSADRRTVGRRAIARQNPCLFGLNFSSCVASSGFFHLPKRKTPENKPFNVRLPWGRDWGHDPARIEAVSGKMMLFWFNPPQWHCHALAPDGTISTEVPIEYGDEKTTFVKLDPKYHTMWYLFTEG